MMNKIKREDTTNTLSNKQSRYGNNNMALHGLQALRDRAWIYALKYRFDPVLSLAHEEYLNLLNGLIRECET